MAQVPGTYSTYDLVGDREDLIEDITNISPTEKPFVSMSSRGKAEATYHEWQTDALAASNPDNAAIEGDDVTFGGHTPTARVGNYTQILTADIITSGTADAIKKAGRKDEFAYQLDKELKQLGLDIEAACLRRTASVAGDDNTARALKGVAGWIVTNVTAKSGAAMAEEDINNGMQDAWTQGGSPTTLMCNGYNKRKISSYTSGVTKNVDIAKRMYSTVVDVFDTDFGRLSIVPNREMAASSVFGLDMDLWKIAVLRDTRVEPLAKTGDAKKAMVLTELTLESRQELGSFAITGTSTTD